MGRAQKNGRCRQEKLDVEAVVLFVTVPLMSFRDALLKEAKYG
jgi:hypothetical protein